ncbi:hypothetical protein [Streptomyces sp. NPDC026092]|uniref:hypothetical protein n=1 Tax=Streptomyces sp. NPDC026092 TaxID=3154797 RepID=UPI0033EFADF4
MYDRASSRAKQRRDASAILQLIESGYQFFGRESTYAQGNARLVAVHPARPAPAPGDTTQPLTLPSP